jgi:hypothetical protein
VNDDEIQQLQETAELRDALHVFGEYLSDKVAPLMALDALELLMDLPPALIGREIVTWCVRQVEVQGGALATSDLLFHSARKIHMMGDFELIEAAELDRYLRALGPLLIEACPPEGREQLKLGLSRLDESRQALATKVAIVHRQSGAPESVAQAAATSAQRAADAAPKMITALVEGLGRLPLLLQRLETLTPPAAAGPDAGAARSTPEAAQTAPVRSAVVADAILEASLQAKDGAELQKYLDHIRGLGIVGSTDEMFRVLGRSVSGWSLPPLPDLPKLPESGQVRAMRRMIALAHEPAEAGQRFREMVTAAIEQFNEGSYGRSLKMFELARQMIAHGEVKTAFIQPVVVSGHEALAEDRIRKLAERAEGHFFLRPVLAFFKAYAPDRLLDELSAEVRRDRRRLLLSLLEVHGPAARASAWDRLQSDPHGKGSSLYFLRNLVYLLRTIQRPSDAPWPHEEEIDAVAALAQPGQQLFLVKEALQYLAMTRHPHSEAHLLAIFELVERAVEDRTASAEDRAGLLIQLDRMAGALARYASPATWAALVDHALSREAQLGDTLARLEELSAQDLSAAPEVVAQLVEAIEESLPQGMLSRLVPGRETILSRLIGALASTRSAEARETLEDVAKRFAAQPFGREAQSALTALDRAADPTGSAPSFSGDLSLFGLANLLQNLCELGKTGVLNLLDEHGRPAASVRLEEGLVIGAQSGSRRGREAVYQLIERPFPGTFAFVRGRRAEPGDGERLAVTPLLVEGVQRHAELQRELALVPEDAVLEATATAPTGVPNEEDYDLVVAIWQRICAGESPRAVEATLQADSYRMYRALAHWVEEGSLRQRNAAAA